MAVQNYLKPPKRLMRHVGHAIADFKMINEGDRILLGVSGGKDSLSLLLILHHLKHYAPIKFELGAITVDPQIEGFDPSPLKDYIAGLGIPYFYQEQAILDQADGAMDGDSFCSFCSRMKRGILYSTLRNEGYNVLALAQHLDDLAESFLMSAFHNGKLQTMKANYSIQTGDIRVIRPLVYARETLTSAYAEAAQLPVIPDSCPACFSMPTQRDHMKQLLSQEEKLNKNLFSSLLNTMKPLMSIDHASIETP
ncbi:MAG: tRNA 2-thiocytidine biosynthesis protein TtcA [gamma proteobacterium symbiont of Bathyaustriella thionipta]|nr:tRNA 2-thiocytidine biosynthesis protein TtcA [gamma proteobacterium symbiont of Bathyaustriella thionipta]MCU7948557.1 tRNA 2-thiocytidine biosynthesis protein TtcA [gamma proteobacterium symbiont of Bathyaustriella thionipta]MCU7954484.1 tRNA 2-thiocytidine biosynthesis protein TtcA [gamma proteobacterium symbiont of Bathyaustriella thionipta]MCU7955165.1 tRNA 2-thiocytidine biosynthesis protein TtcA [gamma proteobacterium symbiont of Bathyaustriella thionipta]MCU7966034.1 tRNA 2-thiocytid